MKRKREYTKGKEITHWGVTVRVNHNEVLTIESNCVYGKHLAEFEIEAIRTAANSLLAFVGRSE